MRSPTGGYPRWLRSRAGQRPSAHRAQPSALAANRSTCYSCPGAGPPRGCLAAGGRLRRSVSSGRARPPIPPVQGSAVRKGTISTPLKPGEVPSRSRTSSPGPGPRGVPVPPRAGASTLAQGPPPGGPVGEPTVPIRIKYAGLARWG